ncbi:MAG: hypothetical protein AAF628_18930 [Planctomycetota bacterium]
MISGPQLPRTRAGLLELLAHHLGEMERGLEVVALGLELDPSCTVDVLAKDAAGGPVLAFAVDQDSEAELPSTVLATRAWLATGRAALARACPAEGLDWERDPRLVALALDLQCGTLQVLAELPKGAVEVYRVLPFRVGGQVVVSIQSLLGEGAMQAENTLRVPTGVTNPEARSLGSRYLDLVGRLDPEIRVEGDRYFRVLRYGGQTLAELGLRDGHLQVKVPADEGVAEMELQTRQDCTVAVDRTARRFLECEAPTPGQTGSSAMEPLQRSIEDAQRLSDDEVVSLGASIDDDG